MFVILSTLFHKDYTRISYILACVCFCVCVGVCVCVFITGKNDGQVFIL